MRKPYYNANHWKSDKKYGNKKVVIDGIEFDSKKEARRYRELKLLEKAGEIKDLQMQVKYILIPAQREPDTVGVRGGIKKGKHIEKECAYVADFVYQEKIKSTVDFIDCHDTVVMSHTETDWQTVVEDTKGFRTKDYIIKRKLMLYIHGIKIKEI
jgi:hypothetical protein